MPREVIKALYGGTLTTSELNTLDGTVLGVLLEKEMAEKGCSVDKIEKGSSVGNMHEVGADGESTASYLESLGAGIEPEVLDLLNPSETKEKEKEEARCEEEEEKEGAEGAEEEEVAGDSAVGTEENLHSVAYTSDLQYLADGFEVVASRMRK
jgi:hypothetical protein